MQRDREDLPHDLLAQTGRQDGDLVALPRDGGGLTVLERQLDRGLVGQRGRDDLRLEPAAVRCDSGRLAEDGSPFVKAGAELCVKPLELTKGSSLPSRAPRRQQVDATLEREGCGGQGVPTAGIRRRQQQVFALVLEAALPCRA